MSSCSEVLSHSKWCSAHACLELSIELRDSITRYVCIGAFYRFYVGLDFISKGLITCLQLRSPHSFCFDGHRVIAFVVHSHCLKMTQKSLIYQIFQKWNSIGSILVRSFDIGFRWKLSKNVSFTQKVSVR